MQTTCLHWLHLAIIALVLVAESSAHVLGRHGEPGGRQLSAKMGTLRRSHRIKARREAARRRTSEEERTTGDLEAEEDAPKDTSHSAVKAIKSRLAKSRKVPARDMDEDTEMESEGSERQLQARVVAAEKAVLSQRSASDDTDETAEEDMTPAEELELDMTGVLDDSEEQDTPSLTLHRESTATAFLPSQDVTAKMGLSDEVDADENEDMHAEVRSQHRAPIPVHHKGATADEGNEHPADSKLEPASEKGVRVSPSIADERPFPKGAAAGGKGIAAAKKGHEAVRPVSQPTQRSEEGKLPAVRKLPPWFREGFNPDSPEKPKARMGSGRAHASRVLSHEEKWLRAHQRHLSVAADSWDVIMYGDDLVEAWRGTFLGQAYGPFSEIPAVWDAAFGGQSYTALAAGIAGDGVEQLKWRLENGELPPVTPPKVLVLAVGSNSKGMAGECRVDLAEETAAEMSELLDELREAMPETQLVLMAPLPKGEYWPNRCTPAFRAFTETLQGYAEEEPEHIHFLDLSASFLVRPSNEIWANATADTRQEINEMFMPDAQHPSAAGMRIIAAELEPLVRRLVSTAPIDMDSM